MKSLAESQRKDGKTEYEKACYLLKWEKGLLLQPGISLLRKSGLGIMFSSKSVSNANILESSTEISYAYGLLLSPITCSISTSLGGKKWNRTKSHLK